MLLRAAAEEHATYSHGVVAVCAQYDPLYASPEDADGVEAEPHASSPQPSTTAPTGSSNTAKRANTRTTAVLPTNAQQCSVCFLPLVPNTPRQWLRFRPENVQKLAWRRPHVTSRVPAPFHATLKAFRRPPLAVAFCQYPRARDMRPGEEFCKFPYNSVYVAISGPKIRYSSHSLFSPPY